MKKNDILLRSTDYKYPTKEERKLANNSFPDMNPFGFENQSELDVLDATTNFETYSKKKTLYNWDCCLTNKIGKLYNAYLNCYTNFNRGIPLKNEPLEKSYVNKIQFDFYSEAYYYYFFSIREVILQILNVFYELELRENKVGIDRIKKKINDNRIKDLIEQLSVNLKESKEIRDGFTHRFPPNQADFRPLHSKENNTLVIRGGHAKVMETHLIMDNITISSRVLANFINDLRNELIIKPHK